MIVETKIKLLSSEKFEIHSSKEAFLASKINEIWQSRDELFKAVAGVFSRNEFDVVLNNFIEKGAVTENINEKKTLEIDEGREFRDYTQICFNDVELKEAPEIPENIKKEILFLYYYGKNLDYYRIFNLDSHENPTAEQVADKCRYYRSLLAGKNFEDIDMFGYRKKLERVRKLINDACQISEPEMKEKYDLLLFSKKSEKENRQKEIRSNEQTAEEHFILAMKFNSEKNFKQAYNEILIALHMDPDNDEYLSFRNELKEFINEKRTEELFDIFKNDEFVLLDEKKLESLIDNILELTDGSAQSHLKLAKIAIEKEMPEMALEHSYQAVKLDNDLKIEVARIVARAKKKIQELGAMADGTKTFEINKSDVLRKK